MKIQQLIYFIEVCNTGTITEAANNLFVSQPSITIAIKELEQEVGANLFRRINKKLHITAEGKYLLSKAVNIVEELQQVKEGIKEIATSNHKITVGLPVQTGSFLMPIILKDFKQSYPDIPIEIVELSSIELIELLEKEEIDVAIMVDKFINTNVLECKKLLDTQLCFITNKTTKFANKPYVTVNEVASQPLVLLTKNYTVTKLINESFKNNKITPNILLTTTHLHTVKDMLSHNIASSFMLKQAIAYDNDSVAIPLEPAIMLSISLVSKKNNIKSESLKTFIKFLEKSVEKF